MFTMFIFIFPGPLSVTIRNCDYVSLQGEAFSWLLFIHIENVRHLELGVGTFVLDPTAANVGEHGPGMSVRYYFINNLHCMNMA